jgi:hypothetical protein
MITAVHHTFYPFRNPVSVPPICSAYHRDVKIELGANDGVSVGELKLPSSHAIMLVRRHAQLTTLRSFSLARGWAGIPGKRRFTSAIQDGFLDLAIALPWPTSFPQYSSTIILITVISRLAVTVPFSVWVSAVQPLDWLRILHLAG